MSIQSKIDNLFLEMKENKKALSSNPTFLLFLLKMNKEDFGVLLDDVRKYFALQAVDAKKVATDLAVRREIRIVNRLINDVCEDKSLSSAVNKLRENAKKTMGISCTKSECSLAIIWFSIIPHVENMPIEKCLDILSGKPKKVSHQPNLFQKNDNPNQKE